VTIRPEVLQSVSYAKLSDLFCPSCNRAFAVGETITYKGEKYHRLCGLEVTVGDLTASLQRLRQMVDDMAYREAI
jgi:hypothetical protein